MHPRYLHLLAAALVAHLLAALVAHSIVNLQPPAPPKEEEIPVIIDITVAVITDSTKHWVSTPLGSVTEPRNYMG